jgi:hypothetical protein
MWQAVFSFRPPAAERGSAMLASSPHLAGRSRGAVRQPGKGCGRRHSPRKIRVQARFEFARLVMTPRRQPDLYRPGLIGHCFATQAAFRMA